MTEDTLPDPRRANASISFRPIEAKDDANIESIVRTALQSFECTGQASAFADTALAAMSVAYPAGESRCFIVEKDGVGGGGGGFAHLRGTTRAQNVDKLRKMFLAPTLRGQGLGRRFLAFLLAAMRDAGIAHAYLETTTQVQAAQRLYRWAGFVECDAPMGRTGHCRCDRWLQRALYELRPPS